MSITVTLAGVDHTSDIDFRNFRVQQVIGAQRDTASMSYKKYGSKSYVLCDEGGQITEAHSISAGLDYPGVGPEHSWLKDSGRATYVSATDEAALAAAKSSQA